MRRAGMLARIAALIALLAVGARLSIPFWPAPLTLQTLILALAGLVLGPWQGFAAVALYLLMGLAGLPVFATGGGPGYIYVPSFGFLLGFLPSVVLIGLLRGLALWLPRVAAYAAAAVLGLVPVYLVGVPYFSLIKETYGHAPAWAILSPFLVFLPGDLIKALAAAVVADRFAQAGIGNGR